ncbi:MAG: CBS domain-containing protein, partial [Polyangiales bacterium]
MGYFARPIREYVSTDAPPPCVAEHTTLPQVQRELDRHAVSALPVVDDRGRVTGMISRSDLLQAGVVRRGGRWHRASLELPDDPARALMTKNPLSLPLTATVSEAVEILLRERLHQLVAIDDGQLAGIFSVRNAMCAVIDDRVPIALESLMTPGVVAVRAVEPVQRALERLETAQVHALVVTDGELPIGLFGQPEALAAMRAMTPSRVEDWLDARLLCAPTTLAAHRAATQAVALGVDHIVALDHGTMAGILTASDLARSGLPEDRQEALRPRST